MDKSLASRCRELLQFLATTKGDLANVTGPPSMLAPLSVVEVGRCWAERPAVFAAAALEPEPARRCLLVLQLVLVALRAQMYVGAELGGSGGGGGEQGQGQGQASGPEGAGSIKKPLNAFLGELFLAEWTEGEGQEAVSSGQETAASESGAAAADEVCGRGVRSESNASSASAATTATTTTTSTQHEHSRSASTATSQSGTSSSAATTTFTTRLVAEQVSHHPPITAMHVADAAHGVRADGYARVEMTFSGAVQVRQVGHAVLRVEAYEEEYLIPLPELTVRGFLSGRLYPEVAGTYHVVGSSGFRAEVRFTGPGLLSLSAWGAAGRERRNSFAARVLGPGPDGKETETVHYTVDGAWSRGWTTRDGRTGAVLDTYAVDDAAHAPAALRLAPAADQDPWESRRAWAGVLAGLRAGDLRRTVAEKTRIEQAQRRMRAAEAAAGTAWTPLLFRNTGPAAAAGEASFRRLAGAVPGDTSSSSSSSSLALHADRTKGVWRLDDAALKALRRPFRPGQTPWGESG